MSNPIAAPEQRKVGRVCLLVVLLALYIVSEVRMLQHVQGVPLGVIKGITWDSATFRFGDGSLDILSDLYSAKGKQRTVSNLARNTLHDTVLS